MVISDGPPQWPHVDGKNCDAIFAILFLEDGTTPTLVMPTEKLAGGGPPPRYQLECGPVKVNT